MRIFLNPPANDTPIFLLELPSPTIDFDKLPIFNAVFFNPLKRLPVIILAVLNVTFPNVRIVIDASSIVLLEIPLIANLIPSIASAGARATALNPFNELSSSPTYCDELPTSCILDLNPSICVSVSAICSRRFR